MERGLACMHAAHQDVTGLGTDGVRAPPLARVHALVGQLDRVIGVVGLVGQQGHAVGGRDRELVAALGERVGGRGHARVEVVAARIEQHAELVAAEPVGRPSGSTAVASLAPRRASSASPAMWPKVSL